MDCRRRLRSFFVLVLLALITHVSRGDLLAQIAIQTGTLDLSVVFNGKPLSPLSSCPLFGLLDGEFFDVCSPSTGSRLEAGQHLLDVYFGDKQIGANLLVDIEAGKPTSKVIDLTPHAGMLSGTAILNGKPAASLELTFPFQNVFLNAEGAFSVLLPPGTSSAKLAENGVNIETLPVSVKAGETVGGARLDFGSAVPVTVTARYQGKPAGTVADSCTIYASIDNSLYDFDVCTTATFQLKPGSHTLKLFANDLPLGSPFALDVAVGKPNDFNPDVTNYMGILSGLVRANKKPLALGFMFLEGDQLVQLNPDGFYSALFPGGNWKARLLGTSTLGGEISPITEFPLVFENAKSITASTIDVPTGLVEINTTFLGKPTTYTSGTCLINGYIDSVSEGYAGDLCHRHTLELLSGKHTLTLLHLDGSPIGAPIPFEVSSSGIPTVVSVDVTPFFGVVLGDVMVDGKPIPGTGFMSLDRRMYSAFDPNGTFNFMYKPGTWRAAIFENSHVVAVRSLTIKAGEIIDLRGGTPPTVTIRAIDSAASEIGGDTATFEVKRTLPDFNPITVKLDIAGTAVNGTDYNALPAQVTIAANQLTANLVVRPIDDSFFESTENVAITVLPSAGYTVGMPASATATITSEDVQPVLIVSPTSLTFMHPSGAPIGPSAQQLSVTSNAGVSFTATASVTTPAGSNWLSVGPAGGSTPGSVTVSVNPAGLTVGTYTGTVRISASGASGSPFDVPVSFTVFRTGRIQWPITQGGNGHFYEVVPSARTFAEANAAASGAGRYLTTVTSAEENAFVASLIGPGNTIWLGGAETAAGWGWLNGETFNYFNWGPGEPGDTQNPGGIDIIGDEDHLGMSTQPTFAGRWFDINGNTAYAARMFYVVESDVRLNAEPSALTFSYQIGGAVPPSKSIAVSGTAALGFTAGASVTSGGNWLSVTPTQASTPGNLNVSVNPAGLGAGTYTGKVTITAGDASNSPLEVPVTLNVSFPSTLSVSPASLSFTYQIGGQSAPGQKLIVSGNTMLNFTASALVTTPNGGSWLTVSPAGGSTPSDVIVSVNPSNLPAGAYSGSITFSSTAALNSPVIIPVSFRVNPAAGTPPHLSLTFFPATGNPTSIISGPDGALWYTADLLLGRISTSGHRTEFPLPPDTRPEDIAVGSDGALWFTFRRCPEIGSCTSSPATARIGRMTTAGALTEFPVTVFPSSMTTAPDGTLWFIMQGGQIGQMTATGSLSQLTMPFDLKRPTDLTFGSDGALWITNFYESSLVRLTTDGAGTQFPLPTDWFPSDIATGPDGAVWFGGSGGKAGRMDTAGKFTEYVLSTTSSPIGVHTGPDRALWFAVAANRLARVTAAGAVNEYVLPAPNRPFGITAGPDGALWTTIYNVLTPDQILRASFASPLSLESSSPLPSGMANVAYPSLSFQAQGGTSPYKWSASGVPAGMTFIDGVLAGTPTVAGTFDLLITVSDDSVPNQTDRKTFQLNIAPQPTLSASPTQFTFSHQVGSINLAAQQLKVSSSASLNFTVAASVSTPVGGSWLSVNPGSGSTPGGGDLTISVNPSGLPVGTYSGSITIRSTIAANSPLVVPVEFRVTPQPVLSTSEREINVSDVAGATLPTVRVLNVSSNVPVSFTTSAQTTPAGGSWLTVTAGGATPRDVNVTVNPQGLAAGTYEGKVVLTATGAANTPLEIPVTFVLNSKPTLSVVPTQLTFSHRLGTTLPDPFGETLLLSATSPIDFTASAVITTPTGGTWLTVVPASGTTQRLLTVRLNPAGLAAGTYSGKIAISAPAADNPSIEVPVTLNITPPLALSALPTSLTFSHQIGLPNPASKTLGVTGNEVLTFSAAASVTTPAGGNWLSVAPGSGSTPQDLTVSVDPARLVPGTYMGSIRITSAPASNSPVDVPVSFTVVAQPTQNYFDDFEAPTLNSFWTVTQEDFGTASLSRERAYAGNQSLKLASTTGGHRYVILKHVFGAPTKGNASVWFYDSAPNQETLYEKLQVYDSSVLAAVGTQDFDAYCYTAFVTPIGGPNASCGSYPQFTTTNVSRTAGWHFLSIDYAASAVTIQIDGATVFTAPGDYKFDTIELHILGPEWRPNTAAYFDNFRFALPGTPQPLLSVDPISLSFSQQIGEAAPSAKTLAVAASSPLDFTASAIVTSPAGATWLSVNPVAGSTPGNLSVSVNPVGLPLGTHNGIVRIVAGGAGNTPLDVPVSFTVLPLSPTVISVDPQSLTFSHQIGSAPPAAGSLNVSSNLPANFTAVASSGAFNWLSVAPTSGATPRSLSVTANPAGLTAGIYRGTITVTSPGAGPIDVQVTFNVTEPAPLITIVDPASAPQGERLSVTVSGQNTHFVSGQTTATFGPGITVNSVMVEQPTRVLVNITIAPDAAPGGRTVAITTGGEAVSLANGFSVTGGVPLITNVNPPNGQQGQQNLNVIVTGQSTHFAQGETTANLGNGIAVNSVTVQNATSAIINISIAPDASVGPRTVTLNTSRAEELVTLLNGFTVAAGTPVLTNVNPFGGQQGQSVSVNVVGQFTHFATGATVANFGAGIVVNSVTVQGPTSATVNVAIASDAAPGTRTIILTSGTEVVSRADAFRVVLQPTLTLNPTSLSFAQTLGNAGPANQTLRVSVCGGFTPVEYDPEPCPAPASFTAVASVTTPTGGSWLSLTPGNGTTPQNLSVSVNSAGLSVGTYTGTITVTVVGEGIANSTTTVPVTFRITNPSGGGGGGGPVPPVPVSEIKSLAPAEAVAGGPTFTLIVTGTAFTSGSVVRWNLEPIATTFRSATELAAEVPASLIASPGKVGISVLTNGISTNGFPYTIQPPPAVESINPTTIMAGQSGFTLTVRGTRFSQTAVILWNGAPLTTTFVSPTEMTAGVSTELVATASTVTIAVRDQGVTSNGTSFVVARRPVISSLEPASVMAGSPPFTLRVNGSDLASQAVVLWNGSPLATSLVSTGQLRSEVPASLITAEGTARITVSQQGITLGPLNFTIEPSLAITSLVPASVAAGSPSFTVVVRGIGFLADSVVLLNQNALATEFVSSTQLNALVPANAVNSPGTLQVAVRAASSTSRTADLTVNRPTTPTVEITGLQPTSRPTDNSNVGLRLASPSSGLLRGTLSLSFQPAAGLPPDYRDPMLRFVANGGTTMDFTIEAGATTADLLQNGAIQQGTVAGDVVVTVSRLMAGDVSVLPEPAPARTVSIARSVPVVTPASVRLVNATNGFVVELTGYSTPRDLETASLTFTVVSGTQVQGTASFQVDVRAAFNQWYATEQSRSFGSMFLLRLPFTVQGDTNAIQSVTVTLTNSAGVSTAVTGAR